MKSILLICLLWSLPAFAQKKLVVLGDSITEGYGVAKSAAFPTLLEAKLKAAKKDYVVINSGVSGATTASGPSRIKWVLKSNPDVILLILGANDGLRGLKIEESEKRLSETVEMGKKAGVKIILGGLYMPPNYGKEYTERFKKMYSKVAKDHKVTLIPFILEKVAGDPKYNLPDGIHPNEEGHKIVADNIFNAIKDEL